jgi:hypothetical protein
MLGAGLQPASSEQGSKWVSHHVVGEGVPAGSDEKGRFLRQVR